MPVKPCTLGTEIVNSMCAIGRVISDQAEAPWGATRGVIRGIKVNGSPGPPDVVGLGWATNPVTSQKVWVGGEKGLDKIEGVWYEQDG